MKKFIIINSYVMHVTNFVIKINKKKYLKGINFTNLKTLGSHIAKLKSQKVSL